MACLVLGSALALAGEVSMATLIGNLTSPDDSVRLQAIDQLGAQGQRPPRPSLRCRSCSRITRRRYGPTRRLRWAKSASAAKPTVPALAELVKDPDETVRRQAIQAVMKIHPGPKVTIPLCVKLLEDSDPGVRMRILNAVADVVPKPCRG